MVHQICNVIPEADNISQHKCIFIHLYASTNDYNHLTSHCQLVNILFQINFPLWCLDEELKVWDNNIKQTTLRPLYNWSLETFVQIFSSFYSSLDFVECIKGIIITLWRNPVMISISSFFASQLARSSSWLYLRFATKCVTLSSVQNLTKITKIIYVVQPTDQPKMMPIFLMILFRQNDQLQQTANVCIVS